MKNSFLICFFLSVVSFLSAFTLEEHNSSRSYPEKSFVIFNGDSYRAVKAVPANTLITNSEFWSNLKTEASQQTLPSGSETPPSTQTDDIVKTLPGGGDGNGSTPPISPPEFSNPPSTLNFVENSVETVHTAFAVGADSYTISGNDASLFTIIEGSGVIKFINSPDYENPTDNNGDNNYSLNIKAENSLGYDEHLLSILVTDDTSDNPPIPVFSTANTVSFKENGLGPVYTANATGSPVYSISGDDEPLFTINSATGVLTFNASPDYENPSDNGNDNIYNVEITASNSAGSAQLSLSVEIMDDTSDNVVSMSAKIVSVNVRGEIGAGGDLRVMGFVLNGTSTVFSRGIGPTLNEYFIPLDKLLPNPKIRLFKYTEIDIFSPSFSVPSGDNDDYGSNENLVDIESTRKNLIPVVNTNSVQAISLTTLDNGFYTLQVSDEDNVSTGIGAATVDLTDTTSSAVFTHVSARGLVSTGEYMFGGFQIVGTGTRKVFVRGRGPSLGAAGVLNTMVDPQIAVFKYQNDPNDDLLGIPSTQLATNDDYTTDANSSAMLTYSTSLYPNWPALDSTEPGMILTLGPGYYTVQLQSKSAENDGNAWIGVDDVTDR